MRIDAVTIFPDYFRSLELSLLGKAQDKNILDIRVFDLRDYTHDKHRTVDDTPYGGGAGMLMKPEPWGEAFDELLDEDGETVVVFTSPAGELFKQETAAELSNAKHLVFACGRYEGIDQRVVEHTATQAKVRVISLGDYVLNGGEVAAMAMIEAIARLVPGRLEQSQKRTREVRPDLLDEG